MEIKRYCPCTIGQGMICLGKAGEGNALRMEFDCGEWLKAYPDARVRLFVSTSGGEEYYPLIGSEGTDRVWIVDSEKATKTPGNGVIELLLIDEETGTTIKSATGYTIVKRSPSAGAESMDGEPGYVRYDAAQTLTDEQKAQARENIGAGTGSGNGEGTGEPGEDGKDGEDGEDGGYYTPAVSGEGDLTWTPSKEDMPDVPGANIKGPQGENGSDGRGIEKIERTGGDGSAGTVDTYTITYTDGTTSTYTVTNGKNGQNASGDGTLSVEIDETLSISGAAADAKMTGDRLNELKEAIPSALPNPYALTINGTVYDGSTPVSITVEGDITTEEGETVSQYIELGTLPYTVGAVTELYLEPSEDCTLTIGEGESINLISDMESLAIANSNTVIENLCKEEYPGPHTVILEATDTNSGNNFYDEYVVTGLEVDKEYTLSATVNDKRARVAVSAGVSGTVGQTASAANERLSMTFTTTANQITIRLFMWTAPYIKIGDRITFSDILLCEGTATEDTGGSVSYELTAGKKTKLVFAKGDVIPAVDGVTVTVYKYVETASGDVYVFLGDSIPCFDSNTGGIGAIPDYMKNLVGGTWHNFAVGGTTMSAYSTSGNGYEYFTLDEWADSIASGDFSKQLQGVTDGATAGSTSYSIADKVAAARILDWSTVKRIYLAYGTNDLAYGVSQVGAATDAAAKNGTMCAALKYAIQTIMTAYPTIELVVCGIIYRYADAVSASEIIAANKAIHETCDSIGVTFAPLFENMGVNSWNRGTYLYDGTHPNAAGKQRYAETLARVTGLN